MSRRETSEDIDVVAADWAARVDHAPLSLPDQQALDAWLTGDVRRLGAYARARAVMVHARRVRASDQGIAPNFRLNANAPAPRYSRRRVLRWGGSAALVSAAAMLGVSWRAAAQTYRTAKGEIRLVPLPDGSTVTLNTASAVQVHYQPDARRVDLLQGEALFDVIKDVLRPFVVTAGSTRVKAVGTSFSMRRMEMAPVVILVNQGVVEVSEAAAAPLKITANVRAVAQSATQVIATPVAPEAVNRALAWREGMLSFQDQPLRSAVAEFDRYSDVEIRFADPAIGDETVTGLYAANNPRGFARSVALSFGLKAEDAPGGIVLSRP